MVKVRLRPYVQVVSGLLHPLLVPLYAALGMLWGYDDATPGWSVAARVYFLLLLLLNYGLLPGVVIYVARVAGWVNTFRASQKERKGLLFVLFLLYAGSTCVLWLRGVLHGLPMHMLGIVTVLLGLLWVLNFLLKVSVHAAGLGGLTGLFAALWLKTMLPGLLGLMLLSLFCTGVVMSARLYLQAHSPSEVYIGAAAGGLLTGVGFCCVA